MLARAPDLSAEKGAFRRIGRVAPSDITLASPKRGIGTCTSYSRQRASHAKMHTLLPWSSPVGPGVRGDNEDVVNRTREWWVWVGGVMCYWGEVPSRRTTICSRHQIKHRGEKRPWPRHGASPFSAHSSTSSQLVVFQFLSSIPSHNRLYSTRGFYSTAFPCWSYKPPNHTPLYRPIHNTTSTSGELLQLPTPSFSLARRRAHFNSLLPRQC